MAVGQVTAALDVMTLKAFGDFHSGLMSSQGTWFGKERECVNRFVMGHLMPLSLTGRHVLRDAAQIDVEVSVYQPEDHRRRETAFKDIVIWRKKFETCWNDVLESVGTPLAVLEWKVRHPKARKMTVERATTHDLSWLEGFTRENKGVLGYSVYLEWTSKWAPQQFIVARCIVGKWDNRWVVRS